LDPYDASEQTRHMMGRDGFYCIHGRGPHGSDGCIVPLERDFQGAGDCPRGKGQRGALFVMETMDSSRFA
jgi:hypothetical protein